MHLLFQTLQKPVNIAGVALHSGEKVSATLCPDQRGGIFFRRLDLPETPEIKAELSAVTTTKHATTLQKGEASVSTTEHLLAALWALGVTNCSVQLSGSEVPILDGSAQGWVKAIENAGLISLGIQRPVLSLKEPVWVESNGASVLGLPADEFRLSVAVDFDFPHARAQTFDGIVNATNFSTEMAPARTFTLETWLEPLRGAGLIRGGSLENAILISSQGYSSPLRFENELARHKALDVVGDLALLFGPNDFRGHLIAIRAGHGLHREWMQKALESQVLSVA